MTRRLLNLVAVLLILLSLLLSAAAVAGWVSGRRQVSRVSGAVFRTEWSVAAARGKAFCFFSPDPGRIYRRAYLAHPLGWKCEYDQPPRRIGVKGDYDVLPIGRRLVGQWPLGLVTLRGDCGPCIIDVEDCSCDTPRWKTVPVAESKGPAGRNCRYRRYYGAAVPLWPAACLFSLPPAVGALRLLRTRRRTTAGLCHVCGYDLRATPERCPECGTISLA